MKVYSSFAKHGLLPLADLILGQSIAGNLKLIKTCQKWSREEVKEYQNSKFLELVTSFYTQSPYYAKMLDALGLRISDIRSIEDIKYLPILTKKIIKENYDRLIPLNINNVKHKKDATGGSTGNPMKYLISIDSLSFTTAFNIFCWERAGWSYGDSYIALGSSSLFSSTNIKFKYHMYNKIRGRIPLNGVSLPKGVLDNYIQLIKRKKVKFIYGYASAIYLLAKYVLENHIELDIKICFPTSEILTSLYRNTIKQAFGCKIMDCYGARDGGIGAYEIEDSKYFVSYNSFVEVIQPDDTGNGKIIVTDLNNFAFPFIRYELGDEVNLLNNNTTSYNGQVLGKILGRTSDIIHLGNGRSLTGPGFTILFKDLNIESYQLKQDNNLELTCFLKRNNNYSLSEEKIIYDTLKRQAGNECKINIEYVDEFLLSKSGKKAYFMV
ncbi:MAG: phenylacetate--CoA ligase family protein [Ignavibacteria bacterium]|jgi:phenylacetate-CoA ligase|nr:phenylacetate--CoA ligase family protein [Ignavibacteria bacterium]